MKEKLNQVSRNKLFPVVLVLGLLTIVAAAGVVTVQGGGSKSEQSPCMQMQEPEQSITGEIAAGTEYQMAGSSDADRVEAVTEETTAP